MPRGVRGEPRPGDGDRWRRRRRRSRRRRLNRAATVALELANRYRLAAITFRAIGALVLASAFETMAEAEMRMVSAEIERPAGDGAEE